MQLVLDGVLTHSVGTVAARSCDLAHTNAKVVDTHQRQVQVLAHVSGNKSTGIADVMGARCLWTGLHWMTHHKGV
eukprot:5358304-Amphidinium_carterae.1